MHLLNDTNKQSINIYLQSNNATTSINESSKIFYLDQTITTTAERILIGLTDFQCAYSFYNINTDINDSITFSTINGSYKIILEPQNYDAQYLAETLTIKLGGQEQLLGGIITVQFNDRTNKFTFSGNIEFSIIETTLGEELGLLNQTIENVLTYTSGDVCNLGGISNIYVRLTNLGLQNIDSRGKLSNVIATIPVDAEPTYYIFFTPPEYLYFMINESYFNYLHIELTDDNGNDIILNGASFTLTLTIHYQYQRDAVMKNQFLLNGNTQNNNIDYQDYVSSLKKKKNKKTGNK